MLQGFRVQRYRHLDAHDLRFKRVNVFIGPNNAGKTSLIRAIRFAADLLHTPERGSAFLDAVDARGRGDLLDRDVKYPGEIELKWELKTGPSSAALDYELKFLVAESRDFPDGFRITDETLRFSETTGGHPSPFRFFWRDPKAPSTVHFAVRDKGGASKHISLDVSAKDAVFQQIGELLKKPEFYQDYYPRFDKVVRELREYFSGFHTYVGAELHPAKVVAGARRDPAVRSLDSTGAEFANVLRHLEQQSGGLREYVRRLGQLLPDLHHVRTVDVSDQALSVRLDLGEGRPFKLDEMSHGTIRAMVLALILSSPTPTTLLSLDEPELNLHPAWLGIVGRWILDCQSAEQIILSTHSPDLLDAFTSAYRDGNVGLFVFNWPKRGVRQVEPSELDSFFATGWELGDLYRVGEPELGGWPW